MPVPTASDLIFSEQANHNFSKTLGDIKRSTLSIRNRLQSIQEDAAFAQRVQEAYDRPLVANERCGSWYIDPTMKGGSAYFKSTDGHTGVWKFSSRRLNLHLLEIIGKHDGCIIIDSTRRGKRMPDALSKTVPIWCSVINRAFFPNDPQFHNLYTPPQVVSATEHAQITALLPSFESALLELDIPIESFRLQISKPLRPIWTTPDSHVSSTADIFRDFHPIICCTVSRRVPGSEASEGGYIQGAGDDTENWAYGLTPSIFWSHKETLFSTSEADLPNLIEMLVMQSASSQHSKGLELRCVMPTSLLYVTNLLTMGQGGLTVDKALRIILLPKATAEDTWRTSSTRLDVGLGSHKVGSRNLRAALRFITEFCDKYVAWMTGQGTLDKRIIIACDSGRDLSIGVALAFLCIFFDDQGNLLEEKRSGPSIHKNFIRNRLSWISTSMPDANPSRATLQSVNSFLMDRPE